MWRFTTNKWIIYLATTCILGLVFPLCAAAQDDDTWAETGRLPIRYFDPSEYKANSKNWDVVQDKNGILYFANTAGMLIYDGVSWELIRMPSNSYVRSLAIDEGGKMYFGGIGDLGFLQVDTSGQLSFFSLLDEIPEHHRDFQDVWYTTVFEDAVFFTTDKYLFRWQNNTMRVWVSDLYKETALFKGEPFVIGDVLFIRDFEELFYLTPADSLEPVEIEGVPISETRHAVLSGPNQVLSFSKEGLLRCTIDLSTTSRCAIQKTEIDTYLKNWRPLRTHSFENGNIAIGFDGHGIALLAPDGSLLRMFGEKEGLQNLEVMDLFTDREGALWVALYDGLARIEPHSAWSTFSSSEGLLSAVEDVLKWDDHLFASTMLGLYQLVPGTMQYPARFEKIQNGDYFHECYDLNVIDATLLAACTTGIGQFEFQSGDIAATRKLYDGFFTMIAPDPIVPFTFFAAGADGVYKFGLQGGEVNLIHEELFASFVTDIAVTPRKEGDHVTRIWALDVSGDVYCIDVPDNNISWKVTHIGNEHNLPSFANSIRFINDSLRVATQEGLYTLDTKTNHAPYFRQTNVKENRRLSVIKQQWNTDILVEIEDTLEVLAVTDKDELVLTPHSFPSKIETLHEIKSLYMDEDSTLWIGHSRGLARQTNSKRNAESTRPTVLIKSITSLRRDSLIYNHFNSSNNKIIIPHQDASLRFNFAAQAYDFPDRIRYRVWLEGYNRSWGKWTPETTKDYTRLNEGTYTFHVEAQDLSHATSETMSFMFRVLPPWHRTGWAYSLWILMSGLLFFGSVRLVNRYQMRRLASRNKLLHQLVEQQTKEIRDKNLSLAEAFEESQVINENLIKSNRTLEDRTDQLREALEANKEILGITAHDLKNPLAGIIGLADMVLADMEDGEKEGLLSTAENLPTLKDEAERMLLIIKDLLDTHRAGRELKLKKEKVILGDIVSAVIRWNRKQASDKQIEIHFHTEANVVVEIDIMSIQRALDNYVSNAIKYSPKQSGVWIEIEQLNERVKVSVRDEGPGLTDEDLQKVFGKMQRLSAKPTAGEHSTGLGLYIVKQLVEAHGGITGVNSIYGAGATFWLTLPIAASESRLA